MIIVLTIFGAILGGALIDDFPGGLIIGALFGLFAAWTLRLSQQLDAVQKQLDAVRQSLKRIDRTIEDAGSDRVAREKEVPRHAVQPEERPAATKAIPPVARTISEKPPVTKQEEAKPAVPPVKPIPPKPPVPPVQETSSREVEYPIRRAAPSPPARLQRSEPTLLAVLFQRWVFGGNPLVKIGAVVLFLGLGFALRYVAEQGWLPLWLRYAGVAATGIGLVFFGWRWRKRADNYGLILQGSGIGVLYLTTLAAMKLHPLIPAVSGFALLFLIAAFAAFLAVMEDAMILAVVAALGGFAAPVLASTGAGNHIVLFSYLTVLNLGILAIAWFKSWRVLNILGFICTFGLGSTWAAEHYRDELFSSTEPFLLLLFGLYVVITVLFARRTLADAGEVDAATVGEHIRQASGRVKYVDGSLAFGVPFCAFWLQHLLVEPYQYGTAISAMGFSLFYFLLALVMIKGTGKRYVLLNETLIALGAIFGTLSIPLLETQWTASAWAIEAAGVYWIGYRQRQIHVRLFAFLVLIGSALYFLPELRLSNAGTVLDGPVLSATLLAVSTGIVYWMMWRTGSDRLYDFEKASRPIVVGFGAAMLATIPLLLLAREWASPALAILGAGLIYLSVRLSDRTVLGSGWIYQVAGGVLFLTTLEAARSGSVLADGWPGLLGTCLVGTAMLAGVAIFAPGLFTPKPGDDSSDLPTPVSGLLLAGLVFINLAPLFVLSWRMSAMIWPVVGIATLVWAVRTRHWGVIVFSLVLQGFAGGFHLRTWIVGDVVPVLADEAAAFMHSGFLGPLIIALAGLVCARLMHRGAHKEHSNIGLGWIAIGWAGLWWAFAWTAEITRIVPDSGVTAALIAVTLATALSWSLLSQRLDWAQLGDAALAYLPVLVILGVRDVLGDSGHPLAGLGALGWPAALIVHGLLLWRRKTPSEQQQLSYVHTAGVWLFIVLASLEVRWWLLHWPVPETAWPLLGSMLVPVAYVYAVSRRKVLGLWPVRDFFTAYAVTAALPLVVYLLGWLWFTNATSTGSAQPLPYLPVLNPLELGYLAVLGGVFLWWRFIQKRAELHDLRILANPVLAGTAFAAVTGGVIRACHHWANVPWDTDALYASDTVQASLSITWGILAISLMLFGNRRRIRTVWILGAILVGVVVVKLFLVELSAVGTLQRIVSFIVVGLLLLLVGYVAPLPPRDTAGND